MKDTKGKLPNFSGKPISEGVGGKNFASVPFMELSLIHISEPTRP